MDEAYLFVCACRQCISWIPLSMVAWIRNEISHKGKGFRHRLNTMPVVHGFNRRIKPWLYHKGIFLISAWLWLGVLLERSVAFAPREPTTRCPGVCQEQHVWNHPLFQQTKTSTDTVIVSDELFEDIAELIQDKVDIPMVPTPIVKYCLSRSMQRLSSDLSPSLLKEIDEMLAAEKTESDKDDFSQNELDSLADRVAQELIAKKVIDVPLLDTNQELEILQQIFRIVFQFLATSEKERRSMLIQSSKQMALDLLGSPESRKVLARRVNAAIDIPVLNEDQEDVVFTSAVNMLADSIEMLMPPELIRTLKGESGESLAEMKKLLIQRVNEKVDLVGFNEEQEESLIRTTVELLIDAYVDPMVNDRFLLTREEQRDKVEKKIASVKRQLELSRARFDREQASLRSELLDLEQKRDELL
jgi:hypothetical protein